MLNENENFEKKKEKTLLHNGARSEEEKAANNVNYLRTD